MKNQKFSIGMLAVLFSAGLAFAGNTDHRFVDPNVKNISGTSTPNWQPLLESPGNGTGEYTCEAESKPCVGYRASSSSPVTDIQTGRFTNH